MPVTPDRAAFREACRHAALVPVWRELVADADTPVSAYARLARPRGGTFLLESVVGGEKWAAYSFIGVEPRATLRVRAGRATIVRRHVETGGPESVEEFACADAAEALGRFVGEHRAVAWPGLPRFFGGAVGYLSYDAARAFEPAIDRAAGEGAPDDLGLDEAVFVLTDTVVVFDNLRHSVKLVAHALVEDPARADAAYDAAVARIDALERRLAEPAGLRPLPMDALGDAPADLSSTFTKEDFCQAVLRAKEHILAGDAFQVVLAQRFSSPRAGADPLDVYRALRVINPSPYMFHLDLGDLAITGASPETLVRVEGRRVEVRPIAGTRRRGKDAAEDLALEKELRADEKERAEHVMLIDLGRNDVGRVSRLGSVRVEETMVVERYSHVMHLVSLVAGELDEKKDALDVLRACFPAGTLSGAPKIRAMQIIDSLEPARRGVYGGAVGYLSFPTVAPDGTARASNLDMAIAIRTLVTRGDRVFVGAGAGIVHDSVPEAEYEETRAKARAALRALAWARGVSGRTA